MITKVCRQCNLTKIASDFPKGRDANGLYFICKRCQSSNSQRRYKGKEPLERWLTIAVGDASRRSSKRSIPFTLTREEIRSKFHEQQSSCVYCHNPFNLHGTRKDHRGSPSIDRLIPSEGYTSFNVVLCCHRCNAIKHDASLQELRTLVESLSKLISE